MARAILLCYDASSSRTTRPIYPLFHLRIMLVESIRRAIGRRSRLWDNQDFIRFWIGETIANFGSHLGLIALPLIAAVTLNASPFEMGLLAASSNLPRMVVGIFAGAWVDRRKRRPIMIGVNFSRALTLLLIPGAAMLDMLTFPVLLAVAVLLGIQGIIFDSAWSAMVPNLVDRKELADANGKLWASMSLAQISGPAIAGTLIAWMSGPNVMILTAIAFVIAAWFIRRIERPEPEADANMHAGPRDMLLHIREGYAELVRNPVVRPLTTTLVTMALGGGMLGAVYVLFLTNDLGLSTRGVGLVFAGGGLGALIGSMVAAPAAKRFGYGRVILWGGVLQGVMNLMIPLAVFAGKLEVAVVVMSSMLAWITFQAYDINRFSLRQSITRPNLMGRVASSTMTLLAAAGMVGSLLGGTIGQIFSVRAALIVAGIILISATWSTFRSPIPGIIELPDSEALLAKTAPQSDTLAVPDPV